MANNGEVRIIGDGWMALSWMSSNLSGKSDIMGRKKKKMQVQHA